MPQRPSSSSFRASSGLIGLAGLVLLAWSPTSARAAPRVIGVRVSCDLGAARRESSVAPVRASPRCRTLEGWFSGHLDWVSRGVVLYQEPGPFLGVASGVGEIRVFADGNGTDFAAVYDGGLGSVLLAPDLSLRLYADDERGATLVVEQPYVPEAMALWSLHSADGERVGLDLLREQEERLVGDDELWRFARHALSLEAAEREAAVARLRSELAPPRCADGESPRGRDGRWTCAPDLTHRGPTGPQGTPGSTGPAGPPGPQGRPGADGQRGQRGEAGPAGRPGLDGAAGPPGRDGRDGKQGPAGPRGATGPTGPIGLTGAEGARGPMGPIGPMGPTLIVGIARESSLVFSTGGTRSVAAGCAPGELMTGCTGYWNLTCAGEDGAGCSYLGAYPDVVEGRAVCVAEAANDSGTAGTLFVSAICAAP